MMDFVAQRQDVGYLRRRLKPGESVAMPPSEENFLSVSARDGVHVDRAGPGMAEPDTSGTILLTLAAPAVRLNPRQSAIGSLRATGVTTFIWETVDRRWGSQKLGMPVSPDIPVFAQRPLIQFVGTEVILSLRHREALRRVLLTAPAGGLAITLLDGARIAVETVGDSDVLYLSSVVSAIEIRLESLPAGTDFTTAYGFVR